MHIAIFIPYFLKQTPPWNEHLPHLDAGCSLSHNANKRQAWIKCRVPAEGVTTFTCTSMLPVVPVDAYSAWIKDKDAPNDKSFIHGHKSMVALLVPIFCYNY